MFPAATFRLASIDPAIKFSRTNFLGFSDLQTHLAFRSILLFIGLCQKLFVIATFTGNLMTIEAAIFFGTGAFPPQLVHTHTSSKFDGVKFMAFFTTLAWIEATQKHCFAEILVGISVIPRGDLFRLLRIYRVVCSTSQWIFRSSICITTY